MEILVKVKCNGCKQNTHEKYMRKGLDEQYYCNNCWLETFTKCFKCGKYEWKRLSSKVNMKYFCSNCHTESTYKEALPPTDSFTCDICGKCFENEEGVNIHKGKSH